MAKPPPPLTYKVVLVPSDQVDGAGCPDGYVKLTGTPGEGSWEEWGPYRAVGELSVELAALGFGVPPRADHTGTVPSAS